MWLSVVVCCCVLFCVFVCGCVLFCVVVCGFVVVCCCVWLCIVVCGCVLLCCLCVRLFCGRLFVVVGFACFFVCYCVMFFVREVAVCGLITYLYGELVCFCMWN